MMSYRRILLQNAKTWVLSRDGLLWELSALHVPECLLGRCLPLGMAWGGERASRNCPLRKMGGVVRTVFGRTASSVSHASHGGGSETPLINHCESDSLSFLFCGFSSAGLQRSLQHWGEAENPAHGPEEKRQVIYSESRLSQNVTQRNAVPWEY